MASLNSSIAGLCRCVVAACVVAAVPTVAAAQELMLVRRAPAAAAPITDTSVLRRQRVDLAIADVRRLPQAPAVALDLFADVSLRATRQRVHSVGQAVTWVGVLDGYPDSNVVLSQAGDELVGHVYAPFGFFRIERDAAGYIVEQIAPGAGERDDEVAVEEEGLPPVRLRTHTPGDATTVDVMVVMTEAALTGFGGAARATATIAAAVTSMNTALRNSGVDGQVRLVYSGVVAYDESGNSSTDLGRAQNPTDGFLDALHATRDEYAADAVVLVTEQTNGLCGLAFRLGSRGPASSAFAVVKRTCMGDGRSFAHELGHTLGATHDWYVSTSGAFTYSKGHVSLAGRFRDLMSYYDLCAATSTACASPLYYANPDVAFNGTATGVAPGTSLTCRVGEVPEQPCDADVAATFRRMLPVVAAFRDSHTAVGTRTLLPGQSLYSSNNWYRLTYQADGNLVLFDDRTTTPLWSTGTAGRSAGQVVLQSDGNWVVYDAAGQPVWSTGTGGNPGAYLVVQNDGNVAIYQPGGQPLWDRYR